MSPVQKDKHSKKVTYTFLMPAYKPDYLYEAIQSILNQTYADFSLIISDDCSPYNVESIVKEFKDSRIIFRKNKVNIGSVDLVAHWNLLLELSSSEFVILSPDDDIYSPKFLEEIDKIRHQYPTLNVIKSRAQDVDANGNAYKVDPIFPECLSQIDNIKTQFSNQAISGIGQYVFRRSSLCDIGGFVNYPVAWWSDVMSHIKLSANGIGVTKDVLFSFRHFAGNISSHKSKPSERKSKLEATIMFCKDLDALLQSSPATKEDKVLITHLLNATKLKWMYSCAAVNSFKENLALLKSHPEAYSSFGDRIKLFRYWLTKDWLISCIEKMKK